jgi:large subunit ribosomal protein L4e
MAVVPVYNIQGKVAGQLELPPIFHVPIRPLLIRRVSEALATHRLQPKGVDPLAGMRTSAESFGVGRGLARVARVGGERHPRAGQAAGVAGVRKGRAAHPPKPEKKIHKRVNRKERRLATASAIAASASRELVRRRGHRVGEGLALPIIVDDELEGLSKTSELLAFFRGLGLDAELRRLVEGRKARTGTSRRRGRVTRTPVGPLIVTAVDGGIGRAARNIPGVDHVLARNLSVLHLAPGGTPGRLTVYTRSALEALPQALKEVALRVLAGGGDG